VTGSEGEEPLPVSARDPDRDPAPCDICGVAALRWRKCKLVCENCGAINKSCADL
jgi:hypothetical protein